MASEIRVAESPQSQSPRVPSSTKSNELYLSFWHPYSEVMYSLYKIVIELPKLLPPPPMNDPHDPKIFDPKRLSPILLLETGQYPNNMCCVSLGSKLYFLGGEFNIDDPYIGEDVKANVKNEKRDVFPRDVYIFDIATHNSGIGASGDLSDKLLERGTPMNSGKARPHAFMFDDKIYVVGSTIQSNISDRSKLKGLNIRNFAYFEVYDPSSDEWTILPDPPIGKLKSRWVGHVVVRKKVILVSWQRGKERLYCFDPKQVQWTKYVSLPSYPDNFSGRIEFVDGTLYGCYHNTVAAIAPLVGGKVEEEEEELVGGKVEEEDEDDEDEDEVKEEDKEEVQKEEEKEEVEKEEEREVEEKEKEKEEVKEEEKEEKNEAEEVKQEEEVQLFKRVRFLKDHCLHLVSGEGMKDFFNFPPQLHSSSSLLHLGQRYFCYVRTGMPPDLEYGSDHAIKDDKRRFISIVIFQALERTYKDDARLFPAKFIHSAHYVVDTHFPIKGFIEGCFSPGLMFDSQWDPIPISQPIPKCADSPKRTSIGKRGNFSKVIKKSIYWISGSCVNFKQSSDLNKLPRSSVAV